MLTLLARNWWLLLIRGIAAIFFGISAFAWPGLTLTVLVLLFGAYALVDGISAIVTGFMTRQAQEWWWMMLLVGVAGIIIGILTFMWPGITALVLLYMIAARAIVSGIFEIAAAVRLRKEIQGEWLLIVAGIASVLFGVLLVIFPGAGALTVTWMIGIYALLVGVLLVILAFRVRSLRNALQGHPLSIG